MFPLAVRRLTFDRVEGHGREADRTNLHEPIRSIIKQPMVTYTKKDIVRRVSESMNVPINQAEPWVENVIVALRDTMMAADPTCRIELRDFGVFEVKETKAKPKARNPKTNEVIYVPSHRKTHFKPSKRMKEFLRVPLEDLMNTQEP